MSSETHKEHPPKTVILIAGPTAVGKSRLAIELAEHFQAEIISADSRQCFKEMSIGTAKPSQEELRKVRHYFIHSHSIHDEMNAGKFEQLALHYTAEIFKHREVAIVCGGTGLYLKAFCEGVDDMPVIPEEIRIKIQQQYNRKGLSWLQEHMQIRDPEGYAQMEQHNPQRLMRALAVVETTGRSLKDFHTGARKKRPFKIVKIGLSLPKEQLWENIEIRSQQMMKQGLLREVQERYPERHLNALQTVGYKELFDYIENKCSLEEAVQQIIIHTRQYAKRQMTWFKKDPDIKWFSPTDKNKIITYINTTIERSLR